MWGRRAIVASLALGAVAAVACEQALSIDGPVVVASTDACGLPVSVSTCQACVASRCCAQASTCAAAPSCAAHESCMLGCGTDYGCRARCEVAEPVAFPSAVPALDTCIAQNCDTPCGITCGVNTSFSDPDAAAFCQSCIAANICPQALLCSTDLTCENVLHCGLACTTSDCQAGCIERYDGGGFLDYEQTLISTCLTPCQFGSIWSCVGRVTWPLPKAPQQNVTITLTNSADGSPAPNVVVTACDRSDHDCVQALGSGISDANGKVTLQLPGVAAGGFGFNGYFDLKPPAGGYPYLVFTDAPLSEPNALFSTTLLNATQFQNLANAAGVTLDPALGHVAVGASDCVLGPATGVVISATGTGPETKLVYYGSGALDPAATATSVTGLAFLFNVPTVKAVTIEATPEKVGRVTSREEVFTRAQTLSAVGAPPTP
jgi:hypothetical protein